MNRKLNIGMAALLIISMLTTGVAAAEHKGVPLPPAIAPPVVDINKVVNKVDQKALTSYSGYSGRDRLQEYQYITTNQYLKDPSGKYVLYMQNDGNLVLYYTGGNTWQARWATNTNGQPYGQPVYNKALFTWCGDLILVNPNGWSRSITHTCTGRIGQFIQIQSDGNLVVYEPIWALWT